MPTKNEKSRKQFQEIIKDEKKNNAEAKKKCSEKSQLPQKKWSKTYII